MDIQKEIKLLNEKLQALEDEFAKYRRNVEDTLNNLDKDNLSQTLQKDIYDVG